MWRRNRTTATVTVIGHGQTFTANRRRVHGYPIQLDSSGGTTILCDTPTAQALFLALAPLFGQRARDEEPVTEELPVGVTGFAPHGPVPPPPPDTGLQPYIWHDIANRDRTDLRDLRDQEAPE